MNFGDGIHDENILRRHEELEDYIADGWTRELIGKYALFWTPFSYSTESNPVKSGFEFDVVSLAEGADYDDPAGGYSTIAHGLAMFDGLRHIWFGDDDQGERGYINYPDSESLVALMTRLYQLEGEYCWNAPQNRGKR